MKRTGFLKRTARLKSGGRLPKRAKVRSGIDELGRLELDDLARACVMVRDGASYFVNRERRVLEWFGRCTDCRRERPLQWSHVLGRGQAPRMIHVPENALAVCSGCHHKWHHVFGYAAQAAARLVTAERMEDIQRRAAVRGKVDHMAQRLANIQFLKERGPWVLPDLATVWALRAERAVKKLKRAG